MIGWVTALVHWAGAHPELAGLLVAAIACGESLAFIGLVIPGAVMMLGAGALIGVGALEFWRIFAWAVAGAIVGDGVSYWIGHRYRDQIARLRYLRNRPELLDRGRRFFQRHGGRSVLLARFVGPVRPVLPVVAGMMGMPPSRFYLYNSLSALAWAPAHLLPGMAFGASVALAGQVAGRLALLFAAVVLVTWGVTWATRTLCRWAGAHAGDWTEGILRWQRRHRPFAWLVGDLLDPQRPALGPLLLWLALLIAGLWLFFGVLEDVVTLDPLVYAGHAFYHLLQQLRTPLGDRVMTVCTELGDAAVTVPVTAAVFSWLLVRGAWRDALYWLAAVGFAALAVATIKLALHTPRPTGLYSGLDAYSFPSGHTTVSTVVYGFLAVLTATALRAQRRWIPYALAALLVIAIGFSRLYLGAHWLADVAAGIGLGTAWVAILAIARVRHPGGSQRHHGLALTSIVVFVAAAGWHIHHRLPSDLQRYAVRVPTQSMPAGRWWDAAWRALPAYRIDLEGEREQPLNVQWAGDLATLRRVLIADGWRAPPPLTLRNALRWLLPRPALEDLPLIPQLHSGHYQALVLVHPADDLASSGRQLVLRLWPTATRLFPSAAPVWIGTVAWQRVERLPLVSFPRNAGGYDNALGRLALALSPVPWKVVDRAPSVEGPTSGWSGHTLLAAKPAAESLPENSQMLLTVGFIFHSGL